MSVVTLINGDALWVTALRDSASPGCLCSLLCSIIYLWWERWRAASVCHKTIHLQGEPSPSPSCNFHSLSHFLKVWTPWLFTAIQNFTTPSNFPHMNGFIVDRCCSLAPLWSTAVTVAGLVGADKSCRNLDWNSNLNPPHFHYKGCINYNNPAHNSCAYISIFEEYSFGHYFCKQA